MSEVLATYSFVAVTGGYAVSCTNKMVCTRAEIPDTYAGMPVVEIYDRAFLGASYLTSVVIPNTIRLIGLSAFYNTRLTFVDIPSSVVEIDIAAFQDLTTLTSVTFHEGLEFIGNGAFASTGITSVSLPSTVKTIGSNAFYNSDTTSFTMHKGIETIGSNCFYSTQISLQNVYYYGNADDWNEMTIISPNAQLLNATRHYMLPLYYNPNGGTLEEGFNNPTYTSAIPSPLPTVTLNPYIFGGWYYDNGTFASAVTSGTAITQTTIIYAKLYNTITYHLDGGTNDARNLATYTRNDVVGAKALYPAVKDGYMFLGWFLDGQYTTPITTLSAQTGMPLVLYAKFGQPTETYFDINLTDEAVRKLFLTYWYSNQYAQAVALYVTYAEQLAGKDMVAQTLNDVMGEITDIEELDDPTFKADRIVVSATPPTGITSGQVYFHLQ